MFREAGPSCALTGVAAIASAEGKEKIIALSPLELSSLAEVVERGEEMVRSLSWGSISVIHLELPEVEKRRGGGILGELPVSLQREDEPLVRSCEVYARWCREAMKTGAQFIWKEEWGSWM